MAKQESRPKRWAAAVAKAQEAVAQLTQAFEELESLKSEYEEWRGNIPENLENGPLAEKLDAIIELEFDTGDVEDVISEAEGVELPLGFGRD